MSHEKAIKARFSSTAERLGVHGAGRVESMRERLRSSVPLDGTERVLDAGTGTGPLALAFAPLVGEVVGLDAVPEMLAEARRQAEGVANVTFVAGDCLALPFEREHFDLTASARTLHHLARPELAVAEMVRVTKPGGRLLVIDQITAVDPLDALAHNRIERLRDPSHVRVLSDADFRGLFEANWLVLERSQFEREDHDLDEYLTLAACGDDARRAVVDEVERLLARGSDAGLNLRRLNGGYSLTLTVAWYLLERQQSAIEPY